MSDAAPARLAAALSDRYRIERPLGEGGMATVYLAEDVKHDRKVALKVLKPELAAVVGAERFLAEIRTTANLQHPHVLPLFDSGEADGFLFYVMPYVGGETLQDRLLREKQLSVDEAVRIASAVAGALDYAHRQGVVHRDIKPANILFQDGQPVVSDFGIALAVGAGSGARLTETGLSVGTPYYMSPEQATGEAHVGPPSDLYALGCVLYEMLVGEPPYTGGTAQAVLGKILTGAAAAPREVRPTIPGNVDAAIRRALEKVPADRFAAGRDFAAALADAGFRHGEGTGREGPTARPLWNPLAIGSTGVAALLALILGWQLLRPEPPAAVTDVDIVVNPGSPPPRAFDLAPDGSFAVFAAPPTTWIKRWASPGTELLLTSDNLSAPRISPDGRSVIGFDGGIGETVIRSLVGEPDVEGLSAVEWAWGADGSLYLLRSDTLWRRADPRASSEEAVVPLVRRRALALGRQGQLEMVPGGQGLLLTQIGSSMDDASIEAVSLPDGSATTLVQGVTPRLAPSGHLVYARADGMLMAAAFDAGALSLASPPVPTGRSVTIEEGRAAFALDGKGTLLYRSGGTGVVTGRLVRVFADGRQEVLTQGELGEGVASMTLSPDGTRLAFRTVAINRDAGVWVKALPDGPLTRVAREVGLSGGVSWSRDGAWLFFSGQGNDLWRVAADASRPAERFLDLQRPIAESDVLDDGTVVVRTFPTGKDRDILVVEPGDTVGRDIFPSESEQLSPSVSPDGRWIAYNSSESGRGELFVQPFPSGPGRVQVSTGARSGGTSSPGVGGRWSADGRTLYFQDADRVLLSVEISSDGGAPRATAPRVVLRPPAGLDWVGRFPDGSFLLAEAKFEPGTLTLVLNFTEELKALVPR